MADHIVPGGESAFLQKPITPESLLRRVAKCWMRRGWRGLGDLVQADRRSRIDEHLEPLVSPHPKLSIGSLNQP